MPDEAVQEPVANERPHDHGLKDEAYHVSGRRILHGLRFGNIGAIYVWIAMIVFFTIASPDTFPTWDTVKTVLNLNAIPGLVALSLVVPMCTRVFDLSVGYVVALTSALSAALIVQHNFSFIAAILLCLVTALAVGLLNSLLIVAVGIDSFIATLATGSVLSAVVILVSNNIDVT